MKYDIIIDILSTDEGDCFLTMAEKENINILLDGGTAGTYHRVLKRKLQDLDRQRKCIDLLVVTHIDNEHSGSISELLKENGSASDSKTHWRSRRNNTRRWRLYSDSRFRKRGPTISGDM